MGLAVVLCLIALLGLKPWDPDESVPRLQHPAFEAEVGDAVALPTVGPAVAVVEAAVAPSRAALVSRPAPSEGSGREGAPTLAVAPARAVAVSAGETAPAPAPVATSPEAGSPPVSTPAPELASAPAPSAPAAPEAKGPGGPVSAGGPEFEGEEEECAGDEYLLTITLLEDEAVQILLEHVAADGSVETLELEGDLEDARSLVLQLGAEGGCVEVQVDEGDGPGAPTAAPEVD
jgi:hypothetical protein